MHIKRNKECKDEYGEEPLYNLASISFDLFYSMNNALQNCFSKGSLMGSPLINTRVRIINGNYSAKRTNFPLIRHRHRPQHWQHSLL